MNIQLYDTRRRAKVPFLPIEPAAVRMYVCGPTVYDFAHIGNARPVIVFDVLFRLLRLRYGADHVTYVRNITDVDDKIIARAVRDFPELPLNEAISGVTRCTEKQFKDDVAALGCLPPTAEPRATEYIPEMRALIERLVARGFAYVAQDHVLFSPAAMKARQREPAYGALAKRSLDEMLAGARVDVAPYKRDPMDFVLWKPSKTQEPGWPSPCGIAAPGRPGWHIECSAMSMAKLLMPYGGGLACDDPDKNVFDIHGGGIDLVFPHHENEVAQSCCAFGSTRMANIFMHNGFLQVEGAKMSKSAGNFITVNELLETAKFGNGTWPGDVLRLSMLRTNYRQPIDWTAKELERAHAELGDWYHRLKDTSPLGRPPAQSVVDALCDDLNTHSAIVALQEMAKKGDLASLRASLIFLGFSCDWAKIVRRVSASARTQIMTTGRATSTVISANGDGTFSADVETEKVIQELLHRRKAARNAKNFAESDRIRDELRAMGFALKDNPNGTTAWMPIQ